MNKTFVICLLFLSIFSIEIKAQEQTKKISHIVLKANNLYQFNQSQLKNYYALGSEVGVYVYDKFYLGFSQYNSVSPGDLSKENIDKNAKLKAYEYGLVAGYITNLNPKLYLYTGIRGGYGGLNFKENGSKNKMETGYVSPDLKLGIKVSPFIGIEAGTTYRFNLGNKSLMGIKANDMNGIGVTIGLVGNIPL